jgi:hypothetical protein
LNQSNLKNSPFTVISCWSFLFYFSTSFSPCAPPYCFIPSLGLSRSVVRGTARDSNRFLYGPFVLRHRNEPIDYLALLRAAGLFRMYVDGVFSIQLFFLLIFSSCNAPFFFFAVATLLCRCSSLSALQVAFLTTFE